MQFHYDLFEPPPLSPDLEWMLQSNQVSDSELAVQLAEDYANRLHFLALFVLGDESRAGRATAAAIQHIVRQRAQFWGQATLRTWVYSQAVPVILRQMTLGWRLERWLDRRKWTTRMVGKLTALRLAVLRLDSRLALPICLVYGHELTNSEAAQVLGLSEQEFLETLAQALQVLPAHTPEILAQVARFAEPPSKQDVEIGATSDELPEPARPRLHQRLLSQVLPNLPRQTRQGRIRRWLAEAILAGVALTAALLVGISALDQERALAKATQLTQVLVTQIVVHTVQVTATPEVIVLAQSELKSPQRPTPTQNPTPLPRTNTLDLSAPIRSVARLPIAADTWEDSEIVLVEIYWRFLGVKVDADNLRYVLRPNPVDGAVLPYEIESYIFEQLPLRVLYRFGGDVEMIRRLIDAGLPVLLQITYSGTDVEGWAAEYSLVIGFDDFARRVDVLVVRPGGVTVEQLSYEDLMLSWLPFGYAYFAIFPWDRSDALAQIMENDFSDAQNYAASYNDVTRMRGLEDGWQLDRLQNFWRSFASATILTYLGEYHRAALGFDDAFDQYARLPEEQKPIRALWYNSRPYWAYYYSGDFERVLALVGETLAAGEGRGLEESLYWRAMTLEAMGDRAGALADVRAALQVHPDFGPGLYLLETLTAESP